MNFEDDDLATASNKPALALLSVCLFLASLLLFLMGMGLWDFYVTANSAQ